MSKRFRGEIEWAIFDQFIFNDDCAIELSEYAQLELELFDDNEEVMVLIDLYQIFNLGESVETHSSFYLNGDPMPKVNKMKEGKAFQELKKDLEFVFNEKIPKLISAIEEALGETGALDDVDVETHSTSVVDYLNECLQY